MLHIQKLFFILFFGIALSQSSMAKTNASIEKAVKSSFSGVSSVDAKQLVLTKAQHSKIQAQAKAAVRTKVYRYYEIKSGAKTYRLRCIDYKKNENKKSNSLVCF